MLVPVNSSSGISGALGSYSGLAGLAGISLPSGGDEGNSAKAIQKISSLSFFENNILTNIHLPDLMAVKSWNSKTNTLTFDEVFTTRTAILGLETILILSNKYQALKKALKYLKPNT